MGNQYWKNKIQLKEAYERGRLEAKIEQRQELTEDLASFFRRLLSPRGAGSGFDNLPDDVTIKIKGGVLDNARPTTITITGKQLQGLTVLVGADKIDDLIEIIRRFGRGEIDPTGSLGSGGTGATLIGQLIDLLGGFANINTKTLESLSKMLESILGPGYGAMYTRYIENLIKEKGLSNLAATRRKPGYGGDSVSEPTLRTLERLIRREKGSGPDAP